MQVNSGMQIMNGQPQQGYPPQANQPYSSSAPLVAPGQRPPAPYQQFSQLPSSAGYPPASGNVEDCVHTTQSLLYSTHIAICS